MLNMEMEQAKRQLARLLAWMIVSPIRFFKVAIAISFPLILGLDLFFFKNGEDLKNVLVEAHGLFFDLVVFGIILASYEYYRQLHENAKKEETEKQQRIERYKEAIKDFLEWQAEEAKYRIVGNIKRLNKEGVTSIDLTNSYLVNANLLRVNLTNSMLNDAKLSYAKLFCATLRNVNFRNADLKNANLFGAILDGANLSGADLSGAIMNEADCQWVDFKDTKGLTFEMLKSCKTLFQAKRIPEDLEKHLRNEHPKLFKKPKDV